ncbi:MAG: GAF domain-containing protein, partial [Anaerolineae bacterium]|nr:GAF domain-containing protein [Anaerolineae bacterium]
GDIRIQSTLASQVAIAIENARAFEENERSRQRMELLATTNADLSLAQTEEDILGALSNFIDHYNIEIVAISTFDADEMGDLANIVALRINNQSTLLSTIPQTLFRSHEYPILRNLKENPYSVLYIENHDDIMIDDEVREFIKMSQVGSMVILPITDMNGLFASITLSWYTPQKFDGDFREIVITLLPVINSVMSTRRAYIAQEQARQENELRARRLESVARVSTETTTVLVLGELLDRVVNLTKDEFGLYHAHIYLLNEDETALRVAAGSGDAGKSMVASGHQIRLSREQSLVVQAYKTSKPVIVNDVQLDLNFLPNPLLPDTHAEMAIPLIVGARILGVLDLQSEEIGRFGEEDIQIKTIL